MAKTKQKLQSLSYIEYADSKQLDRNSTKYRLQKYIKECQKSRYSQVFISPFASIEKRNHEFKDLEFKFITPYCVC